MNRIVNPHMLSDPFFIRNLVYGLQDSFISTTGVLVGATYAGLSSVAVIKTGIILIIVEALSMGFGAFLSEESFTETEGHMKLTLGELIYYGTVMFLSYIAAGLLVMFPYLVNASNASTWCLVIAMISQFILISYVQKSKTRVYVSTAVAAAILSVTIIVSINLA
jgi:hypothetical protein